MSEEKKTKLKQYLEDNGYSQMDAIRLYLALTGEEISRNRMSLYVSGQVEPQTGLALNMAKALGCSVEEIFGDLSC